MRIDRYQPCPCGSGQKIKFCCSADIVDDLARVWRMMDGDQAVAAGDSIEKLLAKHGDRPALLALKGELQLQLGQLDQAAETVADLSKAQPESAVASAFTAILQAQQHRVRDAVDSLQRALELAKDEVPLQIYQAMGVVADLLLTTGHILAARGHYLMQAAIADEEDKGPTTMLVRISQSNAIPLLLKEDYNLARCPENSPRRKAFEEAVQLYERGMWGAARDRFEQIAQQGDAEPEVLKNVAMMESLLAGGKSAVAAYRRYSQLDGIPLDDAAEAEALAQLMDPATDRRKHDVLQVTYGVADTEKMLERLLSGRRAVGMPTNAPNAPETGSGSAPPPKARFRVLDRPLPETGKELPRNEIPCAIGEVLLYGKETDRDARLELILLRTADFEEKLNAFLDLAGEALGEAQHERVLTQTSAVTETLTTRWHLPADTPSQHLASLLAEEVRNVVLQRWPNEPLAVLDDKTPVEASELPEYRLRLLASVLLLELVGEQRQWDMVDWNELRAKLGLPLAEPLDPTTVDAQRLPLVRLTRLLADKLSDDDLIIVYHRSVVKRARRAIDKFGLELVGRDSLAEKLDRAGVYGILAQNTADADRGLDMLEKAKEMALAKGHSPAPYLILELDVRLRQGNAREAQRLVDKIRGKHAKEPGIEASLVRVLANHGLIRPDGLPVAGRRGAGGPPAAQAAPAAEKPGGVWTPDTPNSAGAHEEGEGSEGAVGGKSDKPKIWLPGMD